MTGVRIPRGFPGGEDPAGSAAPDEAPDLGAGTREHYDDAALYDHEYRRRRADVTFYRALAKREARGEPILELACGSGRVTTALIRDGHRVVGIDLSQAMLRRASERIHRLGMTRAARAALVRADMTQFALGRRFPLIVSAFNAFEHLYTRVELAACLHCVREHLTPDGLLAFDVQNPDLRWLMRDPSKRWARTRFKHPTTGEPVVYSTSHVYEPVSQIAYIKFYYESRGLTSVVRLAQRKFYPAELEALLAASGFRIAERHGGFRGEPLDGDSESQVIVCRPAGR